jgi:hypothetical protein
MSADAIDLEEVRRLVAALNVALCGKVGPAGGHLPDRDEIPPKAAAGLAGRDPSTIRRWCLRYKIGRRVGGRWLVDRAKLLALIELL